MKDKKKVRFIAIVLIMAVFCCMCACGKKKSEEAVAVEELIDAIGEVTSLDQGEAINEAQTAFDELTEEQQEEVENREILEEAERAWLTLQAAELERLANLHWDEPFYVDDFGDPTDEAYCRGLFSGTFKNSATNGANLDIMVSADKMFSKTSMDHFSIRLIEYGRLTANISRLGAGNVYIKVKIDNQTYDDYASMLIGDDIIIQRGNALFSPIVTALNEEKEIKIVIETYSYYQVMATYEFTMDSNGLEDIDHNWMP
ncbi:MAG: hypothetical protein IJJ34_02135 [Clostridia bacterium]|nr:hypothetical protein [Clostridia bacterium]MBR3195647.1 hypothetical protein [Clostridia bacterium]